MLTQLISKKNRHKAFCKQLEGKRMQKNKALSILALISISLTVLFTIPIHAEITVEITPDSGSVGTEVVLEGSIETQGGAYSVWFDADHNGTAVGDTLVMTGNASEGSYEVNTTFIVPPCAGSDLGTVYNVTLQDNSTENALNTLFTVITLREISVASAYAQEGDSIAINMSVTGGVANIPYNFTIAVTDPAGTESRNYNVSFTTDASGSGYNATDFPTVYSAGATTNFTGTYNIVANQTLPDPIADAAAASFDVGLTNATTYYRFQTVNVKTSGWAPYQNITITIKNPSMENVTVWDSVNATDGTWTGDWTIPIDAPQGTYTVEAVNVTGDNKAVESIQTFTVQSATLSVEVTQQPEAFYMRTETVTAKINITYPDNTFYTESDLGTIMVRVYQNETNVANVTLAAEDFNATTNEWTVNWASPWNAALADDYRFTVKANEIEDAQNPNKGPAIDVSTVDFEIIAAYLDVHNINTTKTSYEQGEVVTVYFNATYPDGSAVITGSAPINLTMANGTIIQVTATYVPANSRFEAKYTLASEAPLGTWTALLEAQSLVDAANNMGPDENKTKTFEVTKETVEPEPEEVTVDVKITPQSLNMKSNGRWVMVHIKVTGADATDVDVSTIMLDGTVAPESSQITDDGNVVVKFSRAEVQSYILSTYESSEKFSNINLTLTGEVAGMAFEDSDTIKVKN